MATEQPSSRRSRLRRGSVRLRITVLGTGIVAVALALGTLTLGAVLHAGMLRSVAGGGPLRAADVSALAARGPLPSPLPPVDTPHLTLLQVLDGNGNVIAASAQLTGAPPLLDPGVRHRRILHDVAGLGPGRWLAEPTPATLANRPATVIVVTSLAELTRSERLFGKILLVAVPLLLVLVASLIWITVGRALRPVEAMRSEVADITAKRLDRRVAVPPTHDEVARLAATLNDMLDRIESSAAEQRRFVSDASHELRSPVANIRTALEVATAYPEGADWAALAADILRQDERLERITDDMVTLSRRDEEALMQEREPVDLADLISTELRRPVPAGRVLEPAGPLPAVVVAADRHQLARALTNLVDNALRHADRLVKVGLTPGRQWAEITVADDGPGIPPADRERVFDRFVRLDEHRARSDGGSGLGLAIVRELVTANGGTVHLADGPGARFVVRLPLTR
jgi:signal transduction histidine kinase